MALRTELGKARGLGSAKEGVAHWWAQRLTAIALVPLLLWFVAAVAGLAGADQAAVRAWIASPVVSVLLVLTIAAAFHHGQLGVQVVIEDYVHTEWRKMTAIIVLKFVSVLLAGAGIFAVLKIAFTA